MQTTAVAGWPEHQLEEGQVFTLIGDGSYAGRSGSTLSFATTLGRLEVTACTPRIVRAPHPA